MRNFFVAVFFAIFFVVPDKVYAQQAFDMWSTYSQQQGLFTPHINNCSSSESFIQMGPGSGLGFCMENNHRTAAYYEDARQTCVALGKRLPEPVEFKYACINNPGGLSNMTGDDEWGSNFPVSFSDYSGTTNFIRAALVGRTACTFAVFGNVLDYGNSPFSATYRCVR